MWHFGQGKIFLVREKSGNFDFSSLTLKLKLPAKFFVRCISNSRQVFRASSLFNERANHQ
jgi:hypothetical protein